MGTKKGMVRKTARRAYEGKRKKSGTKKGMVRKTARKAYEGKKSKKPRKPYVIMGRVC